MKKKRFSSVLCCLLTVICLLSGCEHKSPLLAHADDIGDLKTDYAAIDLVHQWGYSIENEKGETLSRVPETAQYEGRIGMDLSRYTMEGTMQYTDTAAADYTKSGEWYTFQVPFSKTFTAYNNVEQAFLEKSGPQKEEWKDKMYHPESRVSFYTEDHTTEQLTGGDWSKVVHHCNNVVELYGDFFEFRVCFGISEGVKFGAARPFLGLEAAYAIRGTGKDRVVVALVDGEIQAEGVVGNYIVTLRPEHDSWYTRQEYDETGKLLHTERGYLPEEFDKFRTTMTIG